MPGTYAYLCAALNHYRSEQKVMSVNGWTHPRVIPNDVGNQPYLDGRADCWVWGTWARAWQGMDQSAMALVEACKVSGIDPYRYGADLIEMAQAEQKRNIWAVRWLYLHMLKGGLSFRPPHSMVEHIGFDEMATNASQPSGWDNPPLMPCPPSPTQWPASEHPECVRLWQRANGYRPTAVQKAIHQSRRHAGNVLRQLGLR